MLDRSKSIQSFATLCAVVLMMSALIMLAFLQYNLHWEQ